MAKEDAGPKTDEDRWVTSRKYTALYGALPSSFTSLIRGLMSDEKKNNGQFTHGNKWQMKRLLRGDSMKASIYFAIKTFHLDTLQARETIKPEDMADFFKPFELASLIGILYLTRRARKLCDEEEWRTLSEPMHTRLEFAYNVGKSMENIGVGLALLVGACRTLGQATFLMHDKKGYIEYRRQNKIKKVPFDLEYEQSRWGCTHVEIASNLVIGLGYGTEIAGSITDGLGRLELGSERPNRDAYAVKVTEMWVDSLRTKGTPPEIMHSGNFYPLQKDLDVLLSEADELMGSGSKFCWLNQTKDTLTADMAPELFGTEQEQVEDGIDDAPTKEEEQLIEEMA